MPYKKINPSDFIGKTYNRLTVLESVGPRKHGQVWVRCQCRCGVRKEYQLGRVVNGNFKSCGCLNRDRLIERNTTHRMSSSPEYDAWLRMIKRCTVKTNKNWKDYGGRGITVCKEWMQSFSAFYSHIGSRPSSKHLLDRINNEDGYKPGNVRWVTYQTQQRNKRSNFYVTFRGERRLLIELCEELDLSVSIIYQRIHVYRWDVEDAVTIPIRHGRQGYWSYAKHKKAAAAGIDSLR